MKPFKIIVSAALCAAALSTQAQTREVVQIKYNDGVVDYIPADQIKRISFNTGIDIDNSLYVTVKGMYDVLKSYEKYANTHFDFGYPSIMLGLDCQTGDINNRESGYDWFKAYHQFQRGVNSINGLMWLYMYDVIRSANAVIEDHSVELNDENNLLVAQVLALRSWAYWNLIQLYAPNYYYADNDTPGVPLFDGDDLSATFDATSVKVIYEQILMDIDMAIDMLESTPLVPAHISVSEAKRYVDLSVAYGLRARYALTMHEYADAAKYARLAIDNTSARPLDRVAAAFPGFNDSKLGNWMWAITINKNDRCVTSGIVNFTSHMSSLFTNGYTGVGAARACGSELYNYIASQDGDARQRWFTDQMGINPSLTPAQQSLVSDMWQTAEQLPYINVKFDTYGSNLLNPSPASDVPLMRIEEMYFIEAEGLAMSSQENRARQLLNDFVSTYRNPTYSFASTSKEALQQEIIMQRRLEFWGEGLAYFDKLRLRLDVDRFNDPYCPDRFKVRIKGDSPWMLYDYPEVGPKINGYDYKGDHAGVIYPVVDEAGTWN